MSDRDRQPAVTAFVHTLQQRLSCVSHAILLQERQPTGHRRTVRLAGEWTTLSAPRPLSLSMLLEVVATGRNGIGAGWEVHTAAYRYEIRHANGPMVFAYHWHPTGLSPVSWPHLHLGGELTGIPVQKAHFPTGPITLHDLLRFVIVDLNVTPRRDDWDHLLSAP